MLKVIQHGVTIAKLRDLQANYRHCAWKFDRIGILIAIRHVKKLAPLCCSSVCFFCQIMIIEKMCFERNLKWQEHWSWTPTTSPVNWSVCVGYDKTSTGHNSVYVSKSWYIPATCKVWIIKAFYTHRLIWALNNASVFGVLSWVLTLDKNEPIVRCSWIYLSMWYIKKLILFLQ